MKKIKNINAVDKYYQYRNIEYVEKYIENSNLYKSIKDDMVEEVRKEWEL